MKILQNTPEFKSSEVVVAEEVIDSYLDNPGKSGYYILVANDNSVVVGYVCYGPTPLTEGTWDLYWIAVAPDRQQQGIGRTLLKAAEQNIRDSEGRLVIIETSSVPDYEKTRNFYLNHDYEIMARIPDFYAPGDGKLILQKRFS